MRLPFADSCAAQSAARHEPLAATAKEVRCWLLLEHPGPWAHDIHDSLAPPLRPQLEQLEALVPGLRVQLIRNKQTQGCHQGFFVQGSTIQRFALSQPNSLADPRPLPAPKQLYLVCTHGKRDRCCARLGVPVYNRMRQLLPPEELWQVSHIGGHRFAATLVQLPSSACYGRLKPEDAEALIAAHAQEQLLDLAHYRGNCRLPQPAQAAAIAWRQQQPQPQRKLGVDAVPREALAASLKQG